MKIDKIQVRNFRLLKNITISLEQGTTVIVGRNNAGKTSITELFRRLLNDKNSSFELEDFTLSEHVKFWESFALKNNGGDDETIRDLLPIIEAKIFVTYDPVAVDLGPLGDFIIDLDENTISAEILLKYQLKPGKINTLFENVDYRPILTQAFHPNLTRLGTS